MPVDAYPDLSPPQVEIITQWPGHAAEEVERLVTLPLEIEMNGVPHMVVMRSISLYGLSDIRLTFEDSTNDYFARQVVFERLGQATLPAGVTPSMAPLFSPSGLVYRYVLESPDRSPQELKTIEDWVVERAYRSVPRGRGRFRVRRHHDAIPGATRSVSHLWVSPDGPASGSGPDREQCQRGRQVSTPKAASSITCADIGLVRNTEDIGNIVVGANKGVPIRVRDVGDVTIGHAPRLGEFGFQRE